MSTWTNIPDATIETGKPIKAITGRALRDNTVAIARRADNAPQVIPMRRDVLTSSGTWTAPATLPVGSFIRVTYSGGGGGGGAGWRDSNSPGAGTDGSQGGTTTFDGLTDSLGGLGGKGGARTTATRALGLDGLRSGAAGGEGGGADQNSTINQYLGAGKNGLPSGERVAIIEITTSGQGFDYVVGSGGSGGASINGVNGASGANGYVVVEY